MKPTKTLSSSLKKSNILYRGDDTTTIKNIPIPTMTEILAASKAQNLYLKLQTLEPFFRVTAERKIHHLDAMRLKRETTGMEKSIFGIGLLIGAVAIQYVLGEVELLKTWCVKMYYIVSYKMNIIEFYDGSWACE
ncbi:DNA/RNA polymerase superfamily protein [Salix suchowensis]|nr:DNA/RNA polymerase superfamily protein [Salix suchowensis]